MSGGIAPSQGPRYGISSVTATHAPNRIAYVSKPLGSQPNVQLHGDAHLEQYAFTKSAWGLDDFDDSTRGPALVDIIRFLGSIDLTVRRRRLYPCL